MVLINQPVLYYLFLEFLSLVVYAWMFTNKLTERSNRFSGIRILSTNCNRMKNRSHFDRVNKWSGYKCNACLELMYFTNYIKKFGLCHNVIAVCSYMHNYHSQPDLRLTTDLHINDKVYMYIYIHIFSLLILSFKKSMFYEKVITT